MKATNKPLLIWAFEYLPLILFFILIGLVGIFIWELSSYAYLINEYVIDENERYAKGLAKPIFLEILALVLILSGGYFAYKQNKPAKFFVTASALIITIINIVFVYQMFRHYEDLVKNSILMPEVELYAIVIAIFAVGEFLSYYTVSEYQRNSNVVIDTHKEVDLNQLWTFIELFGLPNRPSLHTDNLDGRLANGINHSVAKSLDSKPPLMTYEQDSSNKQNVSLPDKEAGVDIIKHKPRGKSFDYQRINELLDKGLTIKEVALICKCSEFTVKKAKRERQG
jgi:hypothetical protein